MYRVTHLSVSGKREEADRFRSWSEAITKSVSMIANMFSMVDIEELGEDENIRPNDDIRRPGSVSITSWSG